MCDLTIEDLTNRINEYEQQNEIMRQNRAQMQGMVLDGQDQY